MIVIVSEPGASPAEDMAAVECVYAGDVQGRERRGKAGRTNYKQTVPIYSV